MITETQYKFFQKLFNYYNRELFQDRLRECLINISRVKGDTASFIKESWERGENERKHEINLNPDHLQQKPKKWHTVLVHLMVHAWQHDYGKPSRAGYHNKEWASKMEGIGLIPSATGKPGGKKTGQNLYQYIDTKGLFIKAFNNLNKKDSSYHALPVFNEAKDKNKVNSKTYQCPLCTDKVWGKPGMKIRCEPCDKRFVERYSQNRKKEVK